MRLRSLGWVTLPVLALASPRAHVHAQTFAAAPLIRLTSEDEERLRLSQLLGTSESAGFLLRSSSRLSALGDTAARVRFGVITPELRAVHNSGLPYSLNQDALWASRGWNAAATVGAFAIAGPLRVVIAPTFVSEENLAFQVIPYPRNATPTRSVWANPFHPLPESIDLPLRFGDEHRQRVDPGQSTIAIDAYGFSTGVSTENRWWGPGLRNAITLSNNAPGFAHGFLQTTKPLSTPIGHLDAQLVFGTLKESEFFDSDSTNNTRTLSGLALTWTPWADHGLTLGGARIMMAAQQNDEVPPSAVFDVFRYAGHANTNEASAQRGSGTDQIFSLFARWVFPGAGFEAYAEWARFEEPLSFRDFLEYPAHSQGYTLGFQWAKPLRARTRMFQLQGEATYLEPDPSLRVRPVASSYTSRGVPQGFTNRGRTLGAAIGPGASSQWLAGDVFAPRWRLGAYLSRIRWDNGTLFLPIVPQFRRQDVTLAGGVRGSMALWGTNLAVDFSHAARFYYLFQAYTLGPTKVGGIDLLNNTVSITLSRPVWR